MGSSSSEQDQHILKQNNQWLQYHDQLANQKLSDVTPFYQKEVDHLEHLFQKLDTKNLKSLEIKDFDQIASLKTHPYYPRIKIIFEEELKKLKAKRINFQLFLYLLSAFHLKTEVEVKIKYIFRIYDFDKNLKVDQNDLINAFKMIYTNRFFHQEDYIKLASEALDKYGQKGQIKIQHLVESLHEDEVKEALSFKFNEQFQ